MVTQLQVPAKPDIIYPDSDGEPMADNTKQFDLIVAIKLGLELLFANDNTIFVAGNLLWYPIEGDNKTRIAPDVMVIFGREKGDRGSYQQWRENNIAPQVVFEILSPGNRLKEMINKYRFYQRYGVEEYYLYDPDEGELIGCLRGGNELEAIEEMAGWVSPRLGIRFEILEGELVIYRPDGEPFTNYVELAQQLEQQRQEKEQQRQEKEQERQRAEEAESLLQEERHRSQTLEAKLRELGINPNQL
ncbi:Uma2 family endonuclease [Limnofasciculus baicalensis]|uniref:Uma2 family endonuclease n=1 Tax=Limnofasciculus baicalensis BBK-W-15 TaxID=2699891 RepID=A0AAE3GTF7_9CYAN|nr:Uma2 family endonuclease [Limnofasciculus baicalensis]MCP2729576.1 Uma2 family endonuclease [Limnofasciculus baicalensis BBK-W-15]